MKMPLSRAIQNAVSFRTRELLGRLKPMKLRLAVTNRCNSRCQMCDAWKVEADASKELTLDEYERIFCVNTRFFSQVRHVSVTGGEPTLRNDLEEICILIHKHFPGASLNMNTNGFRAERLIKVASALQQKNVPITYNISLDGMGQIHDEIRGIPNASKMALDSLRQLRDLQSKHLKVAINHVLIEANADECAKVHDFCRENKIGFNPIYPTTGEIYNTTARKFDFSEPARLKLKELFRQYLCENKGREMAFLEILEQLDGEARDFRCWAGRIIFLIEEDGDVFPNGGCSKAWRLGNLRKCEYSFPNMLARDEARQVLRKVKTCRRCRLSCETLTTLKYPESMAMRQKLRKTGRMISK